MTSLFHSWFHRCRLWFAKQVHRGRKARGRIKARRTRLNLDQLEDRFVPAGGGANTDANAVFSVPVVAKPAYLQPLTDPVFATPITRIAGDAATAITLADGTTVDTWSEDARHNGPLNEAWNADGSLIYLENKTEDGGTPDQIYLDGSTYQVKFGTPSNIPGNGDDDQRWNPNPAYPDEVILAGSNSNQLYWFNVVSNTIDRTWTLPLAVTYMGNTKGNPSQDGRFICLGDLTHFFIVDMNSYPTQRMGPLFDLSTLGINGTVDSYSISPSGKYVVVHYGQLNGQPGDFEQVLQVDPSTLALSPQPMPVSWPGMAGDPALGFVYDLGHEDMALDPFLGSADVMIGQEHCGNVGKDIPGIPTVNSDGIGHLVMVQLSTGAVTSLSDPGNGTTIASEAYADHVSCRTILRPGWCFVSYYNTPGARYSDEIIALKMDGSGAVERLAHYHSDFQDHNLPEVSQDPDFSYRSETHPVPSPDGLRVIFASNWLYQGTGGQWINDYVISVTPPTSSAGPLPAYTATPAFTVSWSGQDDSIGSGIASYDVYVSDNGSGFTRWLAGTTQTSATYTGSDGHTYGFYSIATDNVGNVQPKPLAAQAATKVDAMAPTSAVDVLPAFSAGTFVVSWTGQDNSGGSGISSYSVYVSDNGGSFSPLLTRTTQTSMTFTGQDGHVYGFYSVATDRAGNQQSPPTSAQTSTTVDARLPASAVAALPGFSPAAFRVAWSGSDGNGSGIAGYDVYVSDNGSAFSRWLAGTTQTSATYTGLDGHTYGFYSVATDRVGNQQPPSTAAQATTTVDAAAPSSTVAVLPGFSVKDFKVTWSGSDGSGSGIAGYDVYVSDNGSSFSRWLAGTTQTSATYHGSEGHTYGFYSIATDNVGNRHAPAAGAQASTHIPGTITLSVPDFATIAGTVFNGGVASFTDTDPTLAGSFFTTTITWDDGQTTGGTLNGGSGNFIVAAGKFSSQEGRYPFSVVVMDGIGNTASGSALIHVARFGPPPATLGAVAYALSHSFEYYANFITAAYQRYLGRTPTASEVGGWDNAMQNGLTDEQLEAGFIGSVEYILDHGGSPPAWVRGMYMDLLGRTPSQAEVDGWVQVLANGMSPDQVAYAFAASGERETQRITADYQKYLGRTPDPSEVPGWVLAFTQGLTNETVVAGFVGSVEYFQTHYDNIYDWLFSAYQDILGHAPDEGGFQGWLGVLKSG